MRALSYTNQFERDIKRIRKRGKDLEKLEPVISALVEGVPLTEKYRDHALLGSYRGRRECHIEPDWLLVYKLTDDSIIIERTGSHSDLFE
jgi:mRNA interferase YafQ